MKTLLAFLCLTLGASAASLNVGDAAPTKLPTAYLKGTKVSSFDPKKAVCTFLRASKRLMPL